MSVDEVDTSLCGCRLATGHKATAAYLPLEFHPQTAAGLIFIHSNLGCLRLLQMSFLQPPFASSSRCNCEYLSNCIWPQFPVGESGWGSETQQWLLMAPEHGAAGDLCNCGVCSLSCNHRSKPQKGSGFLRLPGFRPQPHRGASRLGKRALQNRVEGENGPAKHNNNRSQYSKRWEHHSLMAALSAAP